MKFFAAIVLVAAVASATPLDRPRPSSIVGQLIDAIGALKPEPVAVGPAIIDAGSQPIAIGPAIIDAGSQPISIGPAIIDFPLPDGGAVSAPVKPSPAVVLPGPVSSEIDLGTPLVQLILNINQASAAPSPVAVGPAIAPEAIVPTPVHIVDVAPEPVHVVEIAPEPVQVVEVAPEPVQVVEAPVPVEPVIIGVPIFPEAVVALPEALN